MLKKLDQREIDDLENHIKVLTDLMAAEMTIKDFDIKCTHDEQAVIMEIAFEVGPAPQACREYWKRVLCNAEGVKKFVGPEPAGPAERAVKARLAEVQTLLGTKKQKGRR